MNISNILKSLQELFEQTPILTTVVGSYPAPPWLLAYPTKSNLRDAMLSVLKIQELAGIDVITDGELGRFDVNHPETQGMIEYYVLPLKGVETTFSAEDLERFRSEERSRFREQPPGVVRGKIEAGTLNLPSDYRRVAGMTAKPLKFTVTSPYMLAQLLIDQYYGSKETLAWDIAEVLRDQVSKIDAAVIQIDEAHLTGHADDWTWAVKVINRVLSGVKGEKAVHLCFGNYGGQTIQKGYWKSLVPFLNELDAGHVVLEFARRGYQELEDLKEVKSELKLGIGVIDIKDNEVESAEEVAQRIQHAVHVLGEERVKWVHPDCGLWMLHRSVAERKLHALVKGRNQFLRGTS